MEVIKISIGKSSIIDTTETIAKQLKIPFDGIVYASIGYMLDHGLTNCDVVIPEYYRKRLDNNAPKKISKTKD